MVPNVRSTVAAAFLAAFLAASMVTAGPGHAQGFCSQIAPGGAAGSNTLLGQYYEIGLRCRPTAPWGVYAGLRYSEQFPNWNPFGILSYTTTVAPWWSMQFVVSARERLGDYEGNRLPEVLLTYFGPGPQWVPTLELSAGSISIRSVTPHLEAGRFGAIVGLRTPVWQMAPGLELVGRARGGGYSYGTGASHSFWTGGLEVTQRLRGGATLGLTYTLQDPIGGTSPLLYDQVGSERVISTRATWPVSEGITGVLSAAWNLHTPTITGREYVLQFNAAAGWSLGVGYRISDGKWFLNAFF